MEKPRMTRRLASAIQDILGLVLTVRSARLVTSKPLWS